MSDNRLIFIIMTSKEGKKNDITRSVHEDGIYKCLADDSDVSIKATEVNSSKERNEAVLAMKSQGHQR